MAFIPDNTNVMPALPPQAGGGRGGFVPDAPVAPAPEQEDRGFSISGSVARAVWGEDTEPFDLDKAIGNFLPSLGENIKGMYQAFRHPVETAGALKEAGFEGVAKVYMDRYGSGEGRKKTFEEDPAGMLLDAAGVSSLLGLGARLPGVAGKVAATAGQVGQKIDPIAQTARGVAAVAKPLAKGSGRIASGILGATTGAGQVPIEMAAEAGFKGGKQAGSFAKHLRTLPAGAEPVEVARQAFGNIIQRDKLKYKGDMQPIYTDRRILKFDKIWDAIDKSLTEGQHVPPFAGGRIAGTPFLPKQQHIATEMGEIVNKWWNKGPFFHTPGGLNDMKRGLGEYVAKFDKGTVERRAADAIYGSVKDTIVNLVPEYGKVMRAYDKAMDLSREMEKTLSLTDKATVDTALRKLMTTMRDTAHSNQGVRRNLIYMLQDAGADSLMHMLAGESLRPVLKPTFWSVAAGGTAAGIFSGLISPWAYPSLALVSPRLMGEAAFAAGKIGKKIVTPIMWTERMMKKAGIKKPSDAFRGAELTGVQAGRVAESQEQSMNKLKTAILSQAKASGIKLHPATVDSLASKLLADNPDDYMKAIESIGENKRLRQVFSGGTKGEQGALPQ